MMADVSHGSSRSLLPRGALRVVLAVAALPVLTVGMIVWHECGHTVAAWLAGDPSARFYLTMNSPQEQCIGCNLYDSAALSPARNALVNAAGVAATQLLAWVAAAAWAARARPRWLPRWLLAEVLFITVIGDLIFQVLQGFLAGVPAREPVAQRATYTDASALVSFTSQATGLPHQYVAGLVLAAIAVHLLALVSTLVCAARRAARQRG
jgi:hypothetical protein